MNRGPRIHPTKLLLLLGAIIGGMCAIAGSAASQPVLPPIDYGILGISGPYAYGQAQGAGDPRVHREHRAFNVTNGSWESLGPLPYIQRPKFSRYGIAGVDEESGPTSSTVYLAKRGEAARILQRFENAPVSACATSTHVMHLSDSGETTVRRVVYKPGKRCELDHKRTKLYRYSNSGVRRTLRVPPRFLQTLQLSSPIEVNRKLIAVAGTEANGRTARVVFFNISRRKVVRVFRRPARGGFMSVQLSDTGSVLVDRRGYVGKTQPDGFHELWFSRSIRTRPTRIYRRSTEDYKFDFDPILCGSHVALTEGDILTWPFSPTEQWLRIINRRGRTVILRRPGLALHVRRVMCGTRYLLYSTDSSRPEISSVNYAVDLLRDR
ncbi:MAG: hypothetical protein WAP35_09795 [Solirubrobacterales bacterium]